MIKISSLELSNEFTYDLCVSLIEDENLKNKFTKDKAEIISLTQDYIEKFSTDCQHQLKSFKRGDNSQKVSSNLTKGDLVKLYSDIFANKKKETRKYYNQIKSLAPYNKCPFCRITDVETLDHIAPKANYPQFSVFHKNLYPCCASCNKRMGSGIFSSKKTSIHPYDFDQKICTEIWLHAKIKRKNPITMEFYTSPPENWSDDLKFKIKNYFEETKLAEKFSINSAAEIIRISDQITKIKEKIEPKAFIKILYDSENEERKNTMLHAILYCLMESEWFCEKGFDYKKSNTLPLPNRPLSSD